MMRLLVPGCLAALAACTNPPPTSPQQPDVPQRSASAGVAPAQGEGARPAGVAEAVFAGGCFWCVEADFDKAPGVIETISGYTGGRLANPRYEDVVSETTGHYEAVKVVYDPTRTTYEALTDYFFRHVDPTDPGGQFCDRGDSYRTAIFATPAQRPAAEAVRARITASGALAGPVVTPVLDAQRFWPAETYHQDYYRKNPVRYRIYRTGCGRDARVRAVWGAR